MPKVTTTMRPDRVMDVSDAEVRNLKRLRILATVDGEPVGNTKPVDTKPVEKKTPAPADTKTKTEG